jgi:hypothetical protein
MGRHGVLFVFALAGCSIEGTRQQGDSCLSDRECAARLRCEVTPSGVSRCVLPTVLDASPESAPPTPDTATVPDTPDAGGADAPVAMDSPAMDTTGDAPPGEAAMDNPPARDGSPEATPDTAPQDTTSPDTVVPDTTAPDMVSGEVAPGDALGAGDTRGD